MCINRLCQFIAGGLYVAVSLVLLGLLPWNFFSYSCDGGATFTANNYPLAFALDYIGKGWAAKV